MNPDERALARLSYWASRCGDRSARLWALGQLEGAPDLPTGRLQGSPDAETLEVEALLLERCAGSEARALRLSGPMSALEPCGPLDPGACAVGTVLCAQISEGERWYSVKVAPQRWACTSAPIPLAEGELLDRWRAELWYGRTFGLPVLRGRCQRASITVWPRPPVGELLRRLDAGLDALDPAIRRSFRAPASEESLRSLRSAAGPLPYVLEALWRHTDGTDRPLYDYGRLLSVQEAEACLTQWSSPLLPFIGDPDLGRDSYSIDLHGAFGPPGAVLAWTMGIAEIEAESLEDWLEWYTRYLGEGRMALDADGTIFPVHAYEDTIEAVHRRGYPRRIEVDLYEDALHAAPCPEPPPPIESLRVLLAQSPLSVAASSALDAIDPLSWGEDPSGPAALSVLRDWLLDRGLTVAPCALASLVSRHTFARPR